MALTLAGLEPVDLRVDPNTVIFPDVPFPGNLRGYHVQEFIYACFAKGIDVIPIEPMPTLSPDFVHTHTIHMVDEFEAIIKSTTGVLTGIGKDFGHAVANHRGVIYDGHGVYLYEQCEINSFRPMTYLILKSILSD